MKDSNKKKWSLLKPKTNEENWDEFDKAIEKILANDRPKSYFNLKIKKNKEK